MNDNYEEMSLDELKAIKELREKKALAEGFKSEDDEKKEIEKLEYDTKVREKAIEDYLKEHPPKDKLDMKIETTKDAGSISKNGEVFSEYLKKSGKEYYDYADLDKHSFEYTDSDAACPTDVSDWSPADVFTKILWHSMYCTAGLKSICVKGLNVSSGDGLSVQIRTIGKFAAPASAGACECVSCTSVALSTYTITVGRKAMNTEICHLDVFDVGDIYRKGVIEALGLRWAEYFDAQIYAALEVAVPGYTETLNPAMSCSSALSGSCCTNSSAFQLYHAIIDLDATMREASYKPDYIIVSPTIAAFFKYKDAVDIPFIMRSQLDIKNGVLTRIGQLKVIEYCGANTCAATSGQELAIIIDSRRAVGMAFGKPPTTKFDENITCDSVTVAMNCYVGFKALDPGALGHVVNI